MLASFDSHHNNPTFFTREQCVDMNLAFAQAMLDARRKGLEDFTIGPVIDLSPLVATHFSPIQYHSGMGSSAQVCIDEMPTERFSRGRRGMGG